jgi:YVTN family beta-propeller protein
MCSPKELNKMLTYTFHLRSSSLTATYLRLLFVCACMCAAITTSLAQTRAYVASNCTNSVFVVDTNTNAIVANIPVGMGPEIPAVTPDGSRVYVSNSGSNTVSVIDTTTNTVISTIAVGLDPYGLAITPDGARVYVVNLLSSTISVIDTTTNTVVASIPDSLGPLQVGITPDGMRAYVTNGFLFSILSAVRSR